jgi:transposase InsO family protein
MGSIGQCYDNAVIESFWGRMQTELLNRKRWKTRIELANAIFDYLEIFHNRQRRHSGLGMRTPIEFELLHQPAQPVARNQVWRNHQTRGTSESPDMPGRFTFSCVTLPGICSLE